TRPSSRSTAETRRASMPRATRSSRCSRRASRSAPSDGLSPRRRRRGLLGDAGGRDLRRDLADTLRAGVEPTRARLETALRDLEPAHGPRGELVEDDIDERLLLLRSLFLLLDLAHDGLQFSWVTRRVTK